jgi:hypothetical protein
MVLLALIAVIAASCSHEYWMRLGDEKSPWRNRFRPWFIRGLFFPWLVWSLFIIGWGESLPSFVPQIIDAQQSRAPWFGLWVKWSILGALVIGFYWTAVTYIWLVARIVEKAKDKKEILANIALFLFFSGTVAGALVYYAGWIHIAASISFALLPVVHFTIDLAEPPHVFTTYSKATAQLKRGNYQDAEWEVISQLEKRDDDVDGWLMLAELYAKQYRNIEDAARVILDICKHPASQPLQISTACHKLADWQLEIAENPIGARAALELLCRRLPGTHHATMAVQRLRQIPRTCEEFDELKQPKKIRLPSLSENPASTSNLNPTTSLPTRPESAAEANRLSDKLTDDPDDIPTREKLALVLAEKLGKLDLAIEQLTLLTEIATATDEQKAKWLAQIASWDFNRTKKKEQFQTALRRIVSDFPQTTHAFAAQRRLYLLEMDFLERQSTDCAISTPS